MESQWEQIAQRLWLNATPRSDPEALRNHLWSPLEAANFATEALHALENLQVMERYLWPIFSEKSINQHIILIAAFVRVKRQSNLPIWSLFSSRPQDFSVLFRRILSLNLDSSLPAVPRLILLDFVTNAFHSLEEDIVRKECAPLVSIAIWHNLHSDEYREKELQKSTSRKKSWRSVLKRFDNAGEEGQLRMKIERAWLYSMTLDFLRRLHAGSSSSTETAYCEHFLVFLTDLLSQLPTRRFSIVLLKDMNILSSLRTSKLYQQENCALLHDLADLYKYFLDFHSETFVMSNVDEQSIEGQHYKALSELQRTAFQYLEHKLKVLSLSNFASIDRPEELQSHLSSLTDVELEKLCQLLDFRCAYPSSSGIPTGRSFFVETLVGAYERPRDFRNVVRSLSILPTEESLYDPSLLRNEHYDSSKPLALPKLNLQYLTLDDFMWRSFQLHQTEAFYEIRKDMENIVHRMKPQTNRQDSRTQFEGFSKMGLPIDKPAIIEVRPPHVGSSIPSSVRAEIILDLSALNERLRHEWETLHTKDIVFLLAVEGPSGTEIKPNRALQSTASSGLMIKKIRTAEIVQVLDDAGKTIRDSQSNGLANRFRRRRLLVNIDPVSFHHDQDQLKKTKLDVWHSINVIARRQGRENNFKPVLETIQNLVGTQTELPAWFQEVFLGYGNPKAASPEGLQSQAVRFDFADTFVDWAHAQETLSGSLVASLGETELRPPYILEVAPRENASSNPKKRRRDQMEEIETVGEQYKISTYQAPNTGPYPEQALKRNAIRFTPRQIQAIMSGVQPGLTIIVGPPGTGKTDVATQIIELLYNNFPSERILLIAHSNQALNQLFQKIIDRNIDARHLLRLGHGEEELGTETSYSKYGRVESFVENRQIYLYEITRLAASLAIEGAHGSNCETADYFNRVYIQPAWVKFWKAVSVDGVTVETFARTFPFSNYFANAPIPELFPADSSVEEARAVAMGCEYHLSKIFRELEAIRPFEIIRNPKDQANHLLVKEARVIAMTSTHAAMRRAEIADLGFRYDTLIMEEAAQITEIESFLTCAMQNPDTKTSQLPLKRIVLVGDHLQNSPVVQNLAVRQYANFEQSLFLRLIRLGVPVVTLDQQGRCRPSIAELFKWRYDSLQNLPHLTAFPEFLVANAGFRHEYQFIDVPDYQGQGEREPTPHFIQNLGEAEYAVAIYQYMRLLGYPAKSISILATYAGQRALIRDVLDHRCKGNELFRLPKSVTTVDKYQGDQNDYVILSMVRTKSVGYLRDVRRLTVALSRARLGLYILGRRALFESCLEMKPAMEILTATGSEKLELVTNEMFPTQRAAGANTPSVEMDGVEHLGQYVFEMTQTKIQAMGGALSALRNGGDAMDELVREAGEEELAREVDLEEDPLYENV